MGGQSGQPVQGGEELGDLRSLADGLSRVTQFSLVVVIENSLPVPCMVGYAIASAPLRRPALIFSLSR